jgi:2-amino-4-hydroxy-6-hydroxymethyldihydropteridine diphosphokinase
MSVTAYLLLGSNLGDREHYLAAAREALEVVEGLEIVAASAVYVSEAQEMAPGSPSFLNQVMAADYRFNASELYAALERIERALDRTTKGDMRPRTIDLDILLFGTQIIATDRLRVPHPKLLKRSFALIPLAEIDPEIVHPATGRAISEYITEAMQSQVMVYRDYVARNV